MSIRVGRTKYLQGRVILPEYHGYTRITVMTPRFGKYHALGPYSLRNQKGQILENVWQFSKVYPRIPSVSIPYSSRDRTIVWEWPAEKHLDSNNEPTAEYWRWREAGMNHEFPVRNPVGWKAMKTCAYALAVPRGPCLNYIASRIAIYVPNYLKAVQETELFQELLERHQQGENLLIAEIDGAHQESMKNYQKEHHVKSDFIDQDSVEINRESLHLLLTDPRHSFGHGYCLAMALLGLTV